MFLRVQEFHRAFDQLISTEPQLPDQAIRTLRVNLILEELNEYQEAFYDNDPVEMADALGDLLYVLAGTAVSYGIASTTAYVSTLFPLNRPNKTFDSISLLVSDFETFCRAEQDDDLPRIRQTIYGMMDDICTICQQYCIPINEVFAEIHRSNMAKLQADGSVLRRDDGKVLKPESWSPPNIKAILDAYV